MLHPKHSHFVSGTAESPRQRGFSLLRAILVLLTGCAAFFYCRFFYLVPRQSSPYVEKANSAPQKNEFNWTSITPSHDLRWTPCYEDFECARLSVPLDYSDPKSGEAAIALTRFPSTIPRNEEGYLGPILFNPGGPGGEGVEMILEGARSYRTILGEGFDLIGFDARGLGFTTPNLAALNPGEDGLLLGKLLQLANSSDISIGALHSAAHMMGDIMRARVGDVAQHVGTPAVARDMLSIVKAHGRDKLQYWGFSYGSVLGATFAAMFPDNVGRLVLDGVVDSENHYAALWSNSLVDADAVLLRLYQACVNAGPLVCPLHENSAEKIHDRVESLLRNLRSCPVSFFNAATGAYGEVDYSLVKKAIFRTLYAPHTSGKFLIFALAALERGDIEPIYQLSEMSVAVRLMTKPCVCPANPGDRPSRTGIHDVLAIACGDGDLVTDDVDTLKRYYDDLSETSSFAEVWFLRLGCAGWKVRAKERFTASLETNTSFPILLIGNTADPVTPLASAKKMSRGFKGSVVLTQDSIGHCSYSATSLCTVKAVRAYFQNGTLPKEGTVCDVQSRIFYDELNVAADTLNAQDQELLMASRGLQQSSFVPIL